MQGERLSDREWGENIDNTETEMQGEGVKKECAADGCKNEAFAGGRLCVVCETLMEDGENIKYRRAVNSQVGGDHYRRFKIQPIEFIEANGLTYTEGCVIKYVCRRRFKGQGRRDVEKAIHYLQMLLEREYANDEQK